MQLNGYREILARVEQYKMNEPLPEAVSNWLWHTDSLTQKLQQACTELTVEITQQGWQAVSSEQKFANFLPNLTACQLTWLREVVLKADGVPVIFAQTVLPQETIDAVAQDVLDLGDQPIGLWLFPQHPQRISLEWMQDDTTGLYARRSVLSLKGYPLAIYELFLPEFPFAPKAQKA
ncbi:4-hydroxybenzoate synthetase [Pasteurellaceae bacterium Orientalotternb1]|nr:4-hydroxybenzoate synthetase [Pasteurellaceae bacterium Orientalotternb1]